MLQKSSYRPGFRWTTRCSVVPGSLPSMTAAVEPSTAASLIVRPSERSGRPAREERTISSSWVSGPLLWMTSRTVPAWTRPGATVIRKSRSWTCTDGAREALCEEPEEHAESSARASAERLRAITSRAGRVRRSRTLWLSAQEGPLTTPRRVRPSLERGTSSLAAVCAVSGRADDGRLELPVREELDPGGRPDLGRRSEALAEAARQLGSVLRDERRLRLGRGRVAVGGTRRRDRVRQ